VCPEKNFITILALRLRFVSKAKRVDWLRQGSWLMTRRHTLRSYGGVSMTAKQISVDRSTADKFAASCKKAAKRCRNYRKIGFLSRAGDGSSLQNQSDLNACDWFS
jgi:hypothetical protein